MVLEPAGLNLIDRSRIIYLDIKMLRGEMKGWKRSRKFEGYTDRVPRIG